MSDIKNVPGVTGGPGGVDETQPTDPQDQEKGARFRRVARRIREERMLELAARQGQVPNTPAVPPGANSPAVTPGGSGPDLQALFSPKVPLNTPATNPALSPTQGPSLLDAFRPPPGQPAPAKPSAAAPIFTPTFQTDVSNVNMATGAAAPLNPMYFATPETADWLINEKLPQLGYPGGKVVMKNSGSEGGPFVANKQEIWIQLPDGTQMNAGFLADYYRRNPEDQFPGLADKYLSQIVSGEVQAQAGKGIKS